MLRIVGIGTALAALACAAPASPVRVQLATAGGIDPRRDRELAVAVADRLRDAGFRVFVDEDPIRADDPDAEARSRARSAGAAHAVVLRLGADRERDGVVDGTALWATRLEVRVVEPEGVTADAIAFVSEDREASAVEARVQGAWVDTASPWIVQQLYVSPEMADVQPLAIENEDIPGFQRLRELETAVSLRSERALHWDQLCTEPPTMEPGVTCFTSPCGSNTLIGVDPTGRAIVQETSRIPILTIPPKDGFWREPPEAVSAVGATAPYPSQTLLRSGNIYGFGVVRAGAAFGALETFGAGDVTGVYAFSLADGHRGALSLLNPREASVFSTASPDGAGVLVCLNGAGCFYDAGQGRIALREFASAEVVSRPEGLVAFGQLRTGELALDPLTGAPGVTARIRGRVRTLLSGLRAMTLEDDGTCALVALDPATRAASRTPLPECLEFPAFAPDGRLVGAVDGALRAWSAGDPALQPVTDGAYEDAYPQPTADGRVLFDRMVPSPREFGVDLGIRMVCAVALPPAPEH